MSLLGSCERERLLGSKFKGAYFHGPSTRRDNREAGAFDPGAQGIGLARGAHENPFAHRAAFHRFALLLDRKSAPAHHDGHRIAAFDRGGIWLRLTGCWHGIDRDEDAPAGRHP